MVKERKKTTDYNKEILVVEDSLTQAAQIKNLLQRHHFKVSVTQNGKQAVDWLSKHKPALIISDIVMPEMNGYELCKKIKFTKNTEDIPVILLTRLSDPEEIIEGLSCGADSFISKPYNKEYLLSHVEKILSEENIEARKKVPFGTQILFKGKKRFIQAEQQNVIKLILDIYEEAVHQNEMLVQTQEELRSLNERLESIVEERTSDLSEEIKLSNEIANRLKESEEKWRTLVTTIPEYIGLVDCEGKFLYLNHYSEGFSEKETIGKSHLDFIPNEWKEFYRQKFEKCISTQKNQIFEYTAFGDNKTLRTYETCLVPIVKQGKVSNVMAIARDITERKKAEDAIIHERRMLRTLIDNLPNQIYVKDFDCRKVIANKADVNTIGFKEEAEVLGKTDIELFPGQTGQRGYADDKRVINSGKAIVEHEDDFVDSKGVRRWLLTTKIPLKDMDGGITGLVGIGHDITERKRVEEELIKAKDKAEESDRLKTAFLHNISHEIRTPMNAIVGFSALLGEPDIDPQTQKAYVEVIMQSSNHLLSIISDIVDISNIEANLVKTIKSAINVNLTLKSICNQFLPKAEEKKIKLECEYELSGSDALIITDSTKLNQILSNLVNNALKFTDKGSIKLLYKLKENFLEFSVSDTGIGIPPDYHERIFNHFYQVQNTISRMYEGTGLGLAISKAYVELLGGKIWLTSEPGKGTSFFFTIPYKKQVMENLVVNEKGVAESFVFPGRKTILVAEDIDSNFTLIRYFLSGSNSEIIRAVNGKEAVEKCFSDNCIDLILMDIKMPLMDGYTAAKLIREKNSSIPIIAQTAYADDSEKAVECGCSGFISKPFDKKGLLRVLSEFI
jgi:PAS domain S-box-containing protein